MHMHIYRYVCVYVYLKNKKSITKDLKTNLLHKTTNENHIEVQEKKLIT